jgi:hypothetical protein
MNFNESAMFSYSSLTPAPPLPPSLNSVLVSALTTRKLPSVLEPKLAAREITLEEAIIYLLSILTSPSARAAAASSNWLQDRVVDVTFYDPAGTYLIPVRELAVGSDTSLPKLVVQLQSLLDQNIQDLRRMTSRDIPVYLVSSVQVRIFNVTAFESFPKVSGKLRGSGEEQHGAKWVQWACDGGEVELYWDTYRRVVQLGVLGEGVQSITKPMFKVRTVLKLGNEYDHTLVSGGHVFVTPQLQPDPERAPTTMVLEQQKKTTENLREEDQAPIEKVIEVFRTKNNIEDVSKANIKQVIAKTQPERESAKIEDRGSAEYRAKMKNSFMFEEYEKLLADFRRKKGGDQFRKPFNPKRNWRYYQSMSGNPEIHKLFDLSNAPYDEYHFPPPGAFNHMHPHTRIPTASEMVPYQEIDPVAYYFERLGPVDHSQIKKNREQKEIATSFDNDDDEVYLLGTCRNDKASHKETMPHESSNNFPGKTPRLDAEALFNSVKARKNISSSQFGSFTDANRAIAHRSLQSMSNEWFNEKSLNLDNGSFVSSNTITGTAHTFNPGFYDVSFNEDGNQAQKYGSLVDTSYGLQGTDIDQYIFNARENAFNHQSTLSNSNSNSGIGRLGDASAAKSVFYNQNTQTGNSLSSCSEILNASKPLVGFLNTYPSGSQFNNNTANVPGGQTGPTFNTVGTSMGPTTLSSYISNITKARRNRLPFPRTYVSSGQLRAESPAFKSMGQSNSSNPALNTTSASPTGLHAVGSASRFHKLTIKDYHGQSLEEHSNSSSDGQ